MNIYDLVKTKLNASTAMITAGKSRVHKIIAVITCEIIYPCVRCRRFIYQINYDYISAVG